MRSLFAVSFVVALAAFACGGSAKKPEGAIVETGSDVPENCCCKSTPMVSEDGRPVFEKGNRMECSSKQGTCVADMQCDTKGGTEDEGAPTPSEQPADEPAVSP